MASPLLMKALGFGLIWLSFVLVLAMLLISRRREHSNGQAYQHVITLAVAMIGLCAMIALGIVSAKTLSHQTFQTSVDRG